MSLLRCMFLILSLVYVNAGAPVKELVKLAPEQSSKLLQIAFQCITETGADPNLLVQIRNKKYSDDENVKNFFLCSFKKSGISSKKGLVRVDKMLDIYPEHANKEAIKKAIEECNKEGGNATDNIYNFFKCYQENTPVRVTLT